jgi:hypothetical protein
MALSCHEMTWKVAKGKMGEATIFKTILSIILGLISVMTSTLGLFLEAEIVAAISLSATLIVSLVYWYLLFYFVKIVVALYWKGGFKWVKPPKPTQGKGYQRSNFEVFMYCYLAFSLAFLTVGICRIMNQS